jgi:ArsR family transcriptional regulator
MSEAQVDLCCSPGPDGSIDDDQAIDLAGVISALGDPVRLRIFSMISASDEVCSCNLEGPIGKSQPTISHHTAKLAAAGLIVGERRGRWTWWKAVPERIEELKSALDTASGQPRS